MTTHDDLATLIFDELKAVMGPLHSGHLARDLEPGDVLDAVHLATDDEDDLIVWSGAPIVDGDSGVSYRPWTDGRAVGFEAKHPDGRSEVICLNPSGGSDDGAATVFLYVGPPADGGAITHLVLFQ